MPNNTNESTSSALSTPVPSRRISWKSADASTTLNEKQPQPESPTTASDNPFHNMHAIPPSPTPTTPSQTPTKPNDAEPTACDIEAQQSSAYTAKSTWKHRALAYSALVFVLIIWLLLCMGVLVMTDNFIPGVLRSYHMLKDMGAELKNVRFEMDGLRAQMGVLYQRIGKWNSVEKVGSAGQGS